MTLHTMKNFICTTVVMSIVLLPHVICDGGRSSDGEGGPDVGAIIPTPPTPSLARSEISLLTQMLADANENAAIYNEFRNYQRQQPNYLAKWPGLRDLLLTAGDYDDDANNNYNDNWNRNLNNELANLRLMERLRQMAAISSLNAELESIRENSANDEIMIGGMPTGATPPNYQAYGTPIDNNNGLQQITFKQHGTKKNVQYMSPCHFKICNMGRKRDVKY